MTIYDDITLNERCYLRLRLLNLYYIYDQTLLHL